MERIGFSRPTPHSLRTQTPWARQGLNVVVVAVGGGGWVDCLLLLLLFIVPFCCRYC